MQSVAELAQRTQRTRSRGNGEGSIYQRSDGKWCAAVTLDGGKRKVLYGKTRQEVAKKLSAALQTKAQGLPFVPERLTVGEWVTYWLEKIARPNVEPKTFEGYEINVRLHILPALGKQRLARLQAEQVGQFVADMVARGKSPRTVQAALATLRNALNQAVRRHYVHRNVAELVDPPKQVHRKVQAPKLEDVRRLLAEIRGHRWEALVFVALGLGLRRGEVLGLQWEDVDLERRQLTVRTTVQRVQGIGLRVKDGAKTDSSGRTVMLPEVIAQALKAHRVRQLEERLLAGTRWKGREHVEGKSTGFVFTTGVGTPIEPRSVNRYFDQVRERAGLAEHTFHGLRHDFASLLLAADVPGRVVMEMMGHTNYALTANRYQHVPDELQRIAADRMDAFLRTAI